MKNIFAFKILPCVLIFLFCAFSFSCATKSNFSQIDSTEKEISVQPIFSENVFVKDGYLVIEAKKEEKEALAQLTGLDRYILQNIQSAAQLQAERSKNSRLWKENQQLQAERSKNNRLWKENQQLKKDLTQARRERDWAKKKVGNICASLAYRVGRAITFIPRKLRGGYRCVKEHGIRYTFRRAWEKIAGKIW